MSSPKTRPHGDSLLELELAQLRAQVAALTDLLVECGVVDRSMLEGRLNGAAARIRPRKLGAAPKKKRGVLARIFSREHSEVGAVPNTRLADQTMPTVNLPFKPVALYGESERITTDKRERRLTPLNVGKCERCWRMRPLSANRLCFRCDR
jgi:hypothetical protein